MSNVREIEGIGEAYATKLQALGVTSIAELLTKGATPEGRAVIVDATGATRATVLRWVHRADLDRVRGVRGEYADLLQAAGVAAVPDLAQRKAAALATKLAEVNLQKCFVSRVPSVYEVGAWIEHAKKLGEIIEP